MTAYGSAARLAASDLPTPPINIPANAALFLDLDGTLAPIMPRPDDVGPDPARAALLARLRAALNDRVAVVSGRSLDDLSRILGQDGVAYLAAVHGLERRTPAGAWRSEPHEGLAEARDVLGDLARCDRGLLLEDKHLSLALHYRNTPSAADAVVEAAERLARQTGLVLQLGDMVAELRTPGQDKGSSVAALLREPAFHGATPIFVGDDLTDEDGFAAAARLGGFGVLVGPERPTAATYRLDGPEAVHAWLDAAAQAVTTSEAAR